MQISVLRRPEPQLAPAQFKAIPLTIHLGAHLTDPVEQAMAQAWAKHLSSACQRTVVVQELVGLVLYLWSEDDPDGHELGEYLAGNRRPLQGLLLQVRDGAGANESFASAELAGFLGQRFEVVASS